jgi:predicted nucleic acid-binding protein
MSTAGSVLLDTSVVVPYLRGDHSLRTRVSQVAGLHMPWAVLGELRFGAPQAPHPMTCHLSP